MILVCTQATTQTAPLSPPSHPALKIQKHFLYDCNCMVSNARKRHFGACTFLNFHGNTHLGFNRVSTPLTAGQSSFTTDSQHPGSYRFELCSRQAMGKGYNVQGS